MSKLLKLIELMREHPDLSVIPLANAEVCGCGFAYYIGTFGEAFVGEYAIYNDKFYDDRDDFKDDYFGYNDDLLCERFGYNPHITNFAVKAGKYTQEQLDENDKKEKLMDEYLDNIAEKKFTKAILIYIEGMGVEDDETD